MFADRSRLADYLTFTAMLIAGLIVFGRVAMPFMVSPGPLALNYVENTPRISSAGMPTRSQFAGIANAGFDTVISLAPANVLGAHDDEEALVTQRGMRYFNIPVDFAAPMPEDFAQFARILDSQRGKRVLVHCQINLRASSFVFLYRAIALKEDPDQAYDDVLRVWQPARQWRDFIRDTLIAHGRPLPLALE
ncbi:MAG: protein tyrosine phosphatase family protein [Burkholderiales bacterium]|nr:protein tyrosine phosphatase family protein [Burkholderiales bacterium]